MSELAKREDVEANAVPARARVDALALAGNMDGLMALGRTLLKSGLLPDALRTPEAVVAVVIKGQELDVPPMHALSHIVVIKGKPTMSAELMRALVLRAGHKFRVIESTRERATVEVVRRDDPDHPTRMSFDAEDVRTAGLGGQSGHQKYPAALKLARATSAVCRAVCPDAIGGVSYTPEEMGAEVDEEGRVVRPPASLGSVRGIREPRGNDAPTEEGPVQEAEVVEDDHADDGEQGDVLPAQVARIENLSEWIWGEKRAVEEKVLKGHRVEELSEEAARGVISGLQKTKERIQAEEEDAEEAAEPAPAPHPDEVDGVEKGGAIATGDADPPATREQVERLRAVASDVVAEGHDGIRALEDMAGKRLEEFTRGDAEEWLARLQGRQP